METAEAKQAAWNCATTLDPDSALFRQDLNFHGPEPIGHLVGQEAYGQQVLGPLRRAFRNARKLPYLFLTGTYKQSIWATATGNIAGEMRSSWLGIPPGPEVRLLRFGEFYRIEQGRIAEIRCLYDILGLAAQAGIRLLPAFAGADETPRGPRRAIGLVARDTNDGEERITRDLVSAMINGCNRLEGSDVQSQRMKDFWHSDMAWHGPWGIGTAYGLREFYDYAQGPSVRSFPNRRGTWPKTCFIAEGKHAAFTGWPSLVGTFNGEPFRGIPPTGKKIGQTIMDFYVRDGSKLAENWVLIDLVKFATDCGVDLLAGMPEDPALPAW